MRCHSGTLARAIDAVMQRRWAVTQLVHLTDGLSPPAPSPLAPRHARAATAKATPPEVLTSHSSEATSINALSA